MNKEMFTEPGRLSHAVIDWSHGRVLGFAVPADEAVRHERVELCLDGVALTSAVAQRSMFDFNEAWGGLPIPPREGCAFSLRIPQASLLPSQLEADAVLLGVRDSQGRWLLEQRLRGPHEVLALTEGAPLDLLYSVAFDRVREGVLRGHVHDRHRLGHVPALQTRLNDGTPVPLPFAGAMDHAGNFSFELSLPLEALVDGENRLHVQGPEGQPLASYPIRLGPASDSLAEHRLQVLEAEVEFLKQLLLTRPDDTAPARLDLFKTEVIGLCSEMLSLQRVQLEREFQARLAAHPTSDAANRNVP
ncbi:hypothetical protein [Ideonella dechloratans]|uniref:hypothetical protein n=1 Tax=Ideonella dechloratans TaxID=36863 RepID=UPI0035B1543D